MTAKQRREHKLGNAIREKQGSENFPPNPSLRLAERIVRWSERANKKQELVLSKGR